MDGSGGLGGHFWGAVCLGRFWVDVGYAGFRLTKMSGDEGFGSRGRMGWVKRRDEEAAV